MPPRGVRTNIWPPFVGSGTALYSFAMVPGGRVLGPLGPSGRPKKSVVFSWGCAPPALEVPGPGTCPRCAGRFPGAPKEPGTDPPALVVPPPPGNLWVVLRSKKRSRLLSAFGGGGSFTGTKRLASTTLSSASILFRRPSSVFIFWSRSALHLRRSSRMRASWLCIRSNRSCRSASDSPPIPPAKPAAAVPAPRPAAATPGDPTPAYTSAAPGWTVLDTTCDASAGPSTVRVAITCSRV
mmetsp:Transcript_5524/g.13816  ORF Transcript_5524/g.13816 Transcript_5524/m.13816 type:complete len:239 (-) Transcript_5524:1064-1780(-)